MKQPSTIFSLISRMKDISAEGQIDFSTKRSLNVRLKWEWVKKVNKTKESIKNMQERNDKSMDTDAKMLDPFVSVDARLKNVREEQYFESFPYYTNGLY